MNSDPQLLQKIRRLSQALIISGAFNIGVLALLSYWMIKETPPTPYYELKPATEQEKTAPLADFRGSGEIIAALKKLSFNQLVSKLNQNQLIENGYKERDLALSCLVTFYHFDVKRALLGHSQPQQRILLWKSNTTGESIPIMVYVGLTDNQFEAISNFARTEKWPFTPKGLFLLLQREKKEGNFDSSLVEAFMLTPEFLSVDLLFNRHDTPIGKKELLNIVLEGSWSFLSQFFNQQKQVNDLSEARAQQFLLDYIKKGSPTAALQFLKAYKDFAAKKLDDEQVIRILQFLPVKTAESEAFALEVLKSPRSAKAWQQASVRLYQYAAEPIPSAWDYQAALRRFAPQKAAELAASKEVLLVEKKPPSSLEVKPALAPLEVKPALTTANLEKTSPKVMPKNGPAKALVASQALDTKSSKSFAATKSSAPPKTKPSYQLYVVQQGDNLWKISRRFNIEVETIKQVNQLNSDALKPGEILKIPSTPKKLRGKEGKAIA